MKEPEIKDLKCVWSVFDMTLKLIDDDKSVFDTINIDKRFSLPDMADYWDTFNVNGIEYDVNILKEGDVWKALLYKVNYDEDYICGKISVNDEVSIPLIVDNKIHG